MIWKVNGSPIMGEWAECVDVDAFDKAETLAKGDYQRSLLYGREAVSGSTLKGKARQFGGKYALSRQTLLARLTEAGIPWSIEVRAHNKRVLVIGKGEA